jgi:hypothetical protein
LIFKTIDLDTCRVVVLNDASFENSEAYKSQLGFFICLADAGLNANIVHFGSQKCKRITRSVMAAELHALIVGFDNAIIIRQMISEILRREIPIDVYID